MSNELSASETTPLQRAENDLSEDALLVNSNNESDSTYVTARNNDSNNQLSSSSGEAILNTTPTTILTTTATTANGNNQQPNNNNNIDQRLGQIYLNHPLQNNNNFSSNQNFSYIQQQNSVVGDDSEIFNINRLNNFNNNNKNNKKMDTNKRILCRVGLDVLILLCVGFPILFFSLWGKAYKRGFFCDDESLKHPFHESTVRNWMLWIIGLVIPVGVIVTVELTISQRNAKLSSNGNNNTSTRSYTFMNNRIPDWVIECYKKIGVFGFGAAVQQLTTDIAKYSIGRLRPHFFAVCQPIIDDNTTCDDPRNIGRYIQDFHCRGEGSTPRMLKEVRLSFPSGHSSFTFYTMVYMALYLQSRMTWCGSKLLRHFLQFLFIMTAWYTALSRISDYKHHWSDVLAGTAIGSLCAVIVANFVSDLFEKKLNKSYFLPRTSQDLNTTLHPPPTTTINGNH